MGDFSIAQAEGQLMPVMLATKLKFFPRFYSAFTGNGIKIVPHKNTWMRKRETSYLVRVEYHLNNKLIMAHVEPWVIFPSDLLVAKMMLLPLEVKENA